MNGQLLDATPAQVRAYLRVLLRPQRLTLVVAVLATVLASGATMASPLLVRHAVDSGVLAGNARALDLSVAGIVVLALAAAALTAVRARTAGAVAEGALERVRRDTTRHLLTLAPGDVLRVGRGDVLARTTADIEVLGEAARLGLPVLARAVTMLAVSAVVLVVISPPLAAVAGVGLVVVVLSALRLVRRTSVIYPRYRRQLSLALGHLRESLAGVRVVQGYGREAHRAAAYAEQNSGVVERYLDGMRARNGFFPLLAAVQACVVAGTLVLGAGLVAADMATVGTVAAAALATTTLYGPVGELAETLDLLQTARAALSRVVGLLHLQPSVRPPLRPRPLPLTVPSADLVLRDVRYAYAPGREVLRGVDLTVAPGERVALVGESGAGKSTLARIAARLADPDEGSASYAGVDLRSLSEEDLRRVVVMAPQDGGILTGSVADNVRLGRPDATDREVDRVLADLGLGDWVDALPNGVRTRVGDGGRGLSSGERQMIGLTRIPLLQPQVVVLDEATSALDMLTARLVEDALSRVLEGRSVLLVAHRTTTAARADRIVVLRDGVVAEQGTPQELRQQEGSAPRSAPTGD